MTGPPPRSVPAVAYYCARGVTVLFSGEPGFLALGDTWEWDGVSWTQAPATEPPPMQTVPSGMAFNSQPTTMTIEAGSFPRRAGKYERQDSHGGGVQISGLRTGLS